MHDLRYSGPHFVGVDASDSEDVRVRKLADLELAQRAQDYAIGAIIRPFREGRSAAEHAAAPAPIERNYFVVPADGEHRREKLRRWRGGEGFPYSWLDIEIFLGLLLNAHHKHRHAWSAVAHRLSDLRYQIRFNSLFSVGAIKSTAKLVKSAIEQFHATPQRWRMNADLGKIEMEITAWLARARSAGRWSAVPPDARAEFLRWYDGVESRASDDSSDPRRWGELDRCLLEAYRVGPRMCLGHSAEAARLVPDSWRINQAWQWATHLSGHGGGLVCHYLLGSREYQASGRPRSPNDVPLMTFDTQDCFSWMWGDVGVVTFWIDPQDLAARDFSRAYVTMLDH